MPTILVENGSIDNLRFLLTMEGFKHVLSSHRATYDIVFSIDEIMENEKIVILFGLSLKWTENALIGLVKKGIHPLVCGSRPRYHLLPFSYLTTDYEMAFYQLTNYMLSMNNDIKKVAFLGFNNDSPHDLYKLEGFIKAIKEHNATYELFHNDGDSLKMINELLQKEDEFDYICASNDLIAILYNSLSKNKSIKLSGFGGSRILNKVDRVILSSNIDYIESGKALANLFFYLNKQDIIYPVSLKMPNKLQVSGTSYQNIETLISIKKEIDFFHDNLIEEIDNIEKTLLVMDDMDYKIISSIAKGMIYEDIADMYFMSLSTVKYRINKCLSQAKVSSKKELLQLFQKYEIKI